MIFESEQNVPTALCPCYIDTSAVTTLRFLSGRHITLLYVWLIFIAVTVPVALSSGTWGKSVRFNKGCINSLWCLLQQRRMLFGEKVTRVPVRLIATPIVLLILHEIRCICL